MSARDDDRDDILPPDAPPGPGEQAGAESFARLVDQLLSDRALPPVMPSEERALIEVAAVVRACTGEPRLAEPRQRALVDEVMTQVSARVRSRASGLTADQMSGQTRGQTSGQAGQAQPRLTLTAPGGPAAGDADLGPVAHVGNRAAAAAARSRSSWSRLRRALPWTVAAVSAAAALVLALRMAREPAMSQPGPGQGAQQAPRLQPMHRSRPADDLIGEIPRPRAAAASDRVDMIFADRLMGYRDLRLRGGRP